MTKLFCFISLSALLLTACDDSPQRTKVKGVAIIAEKDFPKEKESAIDIPPPPAPYTGPKKFCFEMELGNNSKDMTRLQCIIDDDDSIRGRLDYTFSDRLPINGTIVGLKQGKFIELLYTYTDSGQHKVEQLVLTQEEDKLYKKNGALIEENGVLVLETPLKATLQLFLMQVDCQ